MGVELEQELLKLDGVDIFLINSYFVVALFIALYLVYKSQVENKFELLVISYFLLTGEANDRLTFSLPGISFFEIQPERFLFLVFGFFVLRSFIFPGSVKQTKIRTSPWVQPLFVVALALAVFSVVTALFIHVGDLGMSEAIVQSLKPLTVLILVYAFYLLSSERMIATIGRAIIITAVVSAIISLVQTGVDSMFMRVGEQRGAFGDVLRATGLFRTERINAYFMIMAMAWTLITLQNPRLKYIITALLASGVICSFHRMSWLVMSLVLFIYFVKIQKVSAARLAFAGLIGLTLILSIYTFYFQDIMQSSLVQERLSDTVDGRKGYYDMVLEHIGDQPVFGYGGKENEVYYQSMLQITRQLNRATGADGGIHSGYFSTLFYFGVPALVFYILFVVLAILYFYRLTTYNIFFAIPFLIAVIYAVGNLTNTLMYSGIGIFYAIHLGLGLGARYQRGFIYGEIKDFKISFRQILPDIG
ncbi:MAG: O-antigen ligase family protein [Phaeodactylibacter sp.]|nr:O-antigen ligase family protein [Phaeodactylibacter sp.]MCB9290581.1 O-antigen ligase family protein [Lewinellaceae bacterium]